MATIEIKSLWSRGVIYTHITNAESVKSGLAMRNACEDAIFNAVSLCAADLSGMNLAGADFRGANLVCADFSNSNLSFAKFGGADLRNASFSGANLCGVAPRIKNIHRSVFDAASKPGALNMASWHCGTAHCRAGWVVTLAGGDGVELERLVGTPAAATLIYFASDATLEEAPDFYAGKKKALADMERMAKLEQEKAVA